MEKALKFLKRMKQTDTPYNFRECELDEAIAELEEEQRLKQSVIEEIEYALLKPEYENVYLNNAIRFLKDNA